MSLKTKKQKILLFGLAFVSFLLGFIFTESTTFFICLKAEYSCRSFYGDIGQSTALLSLSVLIPLIPLYFTREQTYKAWRKFAIVALPLIILSIIFAKDQGGGMGPAIGIINNREELTMFLSVLFVGISYLLIIVKTIRARKKDL